MAVKIADALEVSLDYLVGKTSVEVDADLCLKNSQLPVSPEALQLFFDKCFHRTVLQAHFRKHLLQLRILLF